MPKPYIHFSREEFAERQQRVCSRMQELGLDGLLLFKIEDMYWLCGFESDGFCIFSCMFVGPSRHFGPWFSTFAHEGFPRVEVLMALSGQYRRLTPRLLTATK